MRSLVRALRDRPVLTAVLGALTITFSAIFVSLADVSPVTAAFFRCAYALPPLGAPGAERATPIRAAGHRPGAPGMDRRHLLRRRPRRCGTTPSQLVGAGLATVLGNTQVVIVPIAAWLFLGERPAGAWRPRSRSCSSASCSSPASSAAEPSAPNPVAGRAARHRHGRRLRGLPARPAARQRRSSPAGRTPVRRHPLGGGRRARHRPADSASSTSCRPGPRHRLAAAPGAAASRSSAGSSSAPASPASRPR